MFRRSVDPTYAHTARELLLQEGVIRTFQKLGSESPYYETIMNTDTNTLDKTKHASWTSNLTALPWDPAQRHSRASRKHGASQALAGKQIDLY